MPSDVEHGNTELLLRGDRLAVTASHGPERLGTGEWVGGWAVRLARAALDVFAQGRSVILVAPDYRDVDQLADTLASLGHGDVVRVDSGQPGSARYASFLRALDDTPRIVLGNRSAIPMRPPIGSVPFCFGMTVTPCSRAARALRARA